MADMALVASERPARITGDYWDINVTEPGYVWVEQPPRTAQGHVVPQPEGLVLLFDRTEVQEVL